MAGKSLRIGGFLQHRSTVDAAIERAQAFLLRSQAGDDHWRGELETDSTITSEHLLLCHLLDQVDREREARVVAFLRSRQLPDGGWNLFKGGRANLSATIKAYFALKLAGIPPDDPGMASARAVTLELGGPVAAKVFTKIMLALFGEYPWSAVPALPVEIMLLPRWFYFNLYEVSYWSRAVIVPLLIVMDERPVKRLPPEFRLDELWPVPRERARLGFARVPRPFSLKTWFWGNFFITVDDALKAWERWGPRPFRSQALEAARQWLEPRVAVAGGLGGIFPAMAYSVLALRCLGYPNDHSLVRGQLREIEALAAKTLEGIYYQPCPSPVWDTALAVNALIESGVAADHPPLHRAGEWLLGKQILVPGDWQVKRPHAQPGGWAFQYDNSFYPDVDDTAMVLMALQKIRGLDPERKRFALARGLRWMLDMQGRDGGWSSYDPDNNRHILNYMPFADHEALLDPSTEDLAGRGLEVLGTIGYGRDFPAARRAIEFLKRTQHPGGPWYGRWGVNYIYGTWSVLRGLRAIGEDLSQNYVQKALRWLEAKQNPDGGWGESCESYEDPSLAGEGPSTPTQTAWALLGLFAGGRTSGAAGERGIRYLLETQRDDGSWEDGYWNGTGFPRVLYLKYHLYAKYFPLWALGAYCHSHQ